LVIPDVTELVTLADVRELVERLLPQGVRRKWTWRLVDKKLDAAALGADPLEVLIALRLALAMEGMPSQPK
jgi:hypothetical protein